ncbi:MAG TPA: type I glutamate--ammonia ligase [Polyangiaceae bacterium]|jgi:glutamine synthetase|nr:type I glutamate--ammonia ligase [Polyangiaceae bacterium]
MTPQDVLKLIADKGITYVDLRFVDTIGKEQHVTIPAHEVDEKFFKVGKMFDGSSIAGWKHINESDMILMPDASTAVIDIFFKDPTVIIRCDVIEPADMKGYNRDPRSIAKRAMAYLVSTGIADGATFGPENEFFIFDSVQWSTQMKGSFFNIESSEAAWSSGLAYAGGNNGHRPGIKGGYFPVPPVDALQDIRSEMCTALEAMGLVVEVHHHEVATAGQCEIGVNGGGLVKKADEVLMLKYVVQQVANKHGKTATFMPKPLVGDNGSGMHVHQSLQKGGNAVFSGNVYAGLSQEALWYIGGIIKHARALNAFTNPGTNSYRRLVPGFEAPTILAYSARNRSASIRIPWVSNPKAARIEVRFPDSSSNPYLAFSAMMMAGLDGIKNKIDPGKPADKDLYELSPEEEAKLLTVSHSLDMSIDALNADREFLRQGDVFNDDMIDAYIGLKMKEVTRLRQTTVPFEFELYYSL